VKIIKDTLDKHLFMDESRKAMIIDGVFKNSRTIADLKSKDLSYSVVNHPII